MKTILSIDGGGIRGLIPALLLAELEKRTSQPISDLFDLIAGTSTGGILALGLSLPKSNKKPKFKAQDLVKLYQERGRDIFSRSFWKGVSSAGGFADEKYSHSGLEKVLKEYFGNSGLGKARTNVLVSSYDIQNRTPYFFKSWRDGHQTIEMRHIARATSAAPTFFEPALLDTDESTRALVDGGVFINNPAMSAYAEMKRMISKSDPEEPILIVSLGTGSLTRPISYEDAKDWGQLGWMLPLLSVIFDGVSDAVDYQLNEILDSEHFFRFQAKLETANDDMDDASRANLEALRLEAERLIISHDERLDELVALLTER